MIGNNNSAPQFSEKLSSPKKEFHSSHEQICITEKIVLNYYYTFNLAYQNFVGICFFSYRISSYTRSSVSPLDLKSLN